MATYTFTFDNSNDGQTFVVNDLIDTTKNPIFNGPVNHNAVSPPIKCWVGDAGRGDVTIQGAHGPLVQFEVRQDGDVLRY